MQDATFTDPGALSTCFNSSKEVGMYVGVYLGMHHMYMYVLKYFSRAT